MGKMYEEDMYLPKDKMCCHCYHFTRCVWLIGIGGSERHCDWSPSRFKDAKTKIDTGAIDG